MSLRKTIEVVTKPAAEGSITQYAIAGAVAASNYIQPTLTEDLDILVSVEDLEERTSGLILLTPIERRLQSRDTPREAISVSECRRPHRSKGEGSGGARA
jgi:hypothetical protein